MSIDLSNITDAEFRQMSALLRKHKKKTSSGSQELASALRQIMRNRKNSLDHQLDQLDIQDSKPVDIGEFRVGHRAVHEVVPPGSGSSSDQDSPLNGESKCRTTKTAIDTVQLQLSSQRFIRHRRASISPSSQGSSSSELPPEEKTGVVDGVLKHLTINIVGGSIAGLTTAIELLRHGANVKIYERSGGSLTSRGAGLGISAQLIQYFLAPNQAATSPTSASSPLSPDSTHPKSPSASSRSGDGTSSSPDVVCLYQQGTCQCGAGINNCTLVSHPDVTVTNYDLLYQGLTHVFEQLSGQILSPSDPSTLTHDGDHRPPVFHLSHSLSSLQFVPSAHSSLSSRAPDQVVQLKFRNRSESTHCHLAVFADGIHSMGRKLLHELAHSAPDVLPSSDGAAGHEADVDPVYGGYVIWRGLLPESDVPEGVRSHFFNRSPDDPRLYRHIISSVPSATMKLVAVAYAVPGPQGDIRPGQRRLNWAFYYPVPKSELSTLLTDKEGVQRQSFLPRGACPDSNVRHIINSVRSQFPDHFIQLLTATDGSEYQVQAVYDYLPGRMAYAAQGTGACLIGDAAHMAWPLTGHGATAAMEDAKALVESLLNNTTHTHTNIPAALQQYQAARLPHCQNIVKMGRNMAKQVLTL